jgi:hypothetical protein
VLLVFLLYFVLYVVLVVILGFGLDLLICASPTTSS